MGTSTRCVSRDTRMRKPVHINRCQRAPLVDARQCWHRSDVLRGASTAVYQTAVRVLTRTPVSAGRRPVPDTIGAPAVWARRFEDPDPLDQNTR